MSAHTRHALPHGHDAADLIAANGGHLTRSALLARPRRAAFRTRGVRGLVLGTATAALLVTGAGVASARPVLDPPTHTYCGPGYYPWDEYHACHKIKQLNAPSHQDAGAWGTAALALFGLVALL